MLIEKGLWPNCDFKAQLGRIAFRVELKACTCASFIEKAPWPNCDCKAQLGHIIFVGAQLKIEKGLWPNCYF